MVNGRRELLPLRGPARDALAVALIAIGAVVALIVAYRSLTVLKMVALSMLLALVLRTAARGLDRLGVSRFLAATILLAGVGAVVALLYFVVLPEVARDLRMISFGGPGSLAALERYLHGLPLSSDLDDILQRLQGPLSGFVNVVPRVLAAAASAVGGVVVVVFLALYFAVSPDTYVRGVLRLVPPGRREGRGGSSRSSPGGCKAGSRVP
jgi:predicted PurR-regulated permease PerM